MTSPLRGLSILLVVIGLAGTPAHSIARAATALHARSTFNVQGSTFGLRINPTENGSLVARCPACARTSALTGAGSKWQMAHPSPAPHFQFDSMKLGRFGSTIAAAPVLASAPAPQSGIHPHTVLTVNSLADDKTSTSCPSPGQPDFTLRCALQKANIDRSGDVIDFAVGGTITVNNSFGPLAILATNTTINGYPSSADWNTNPMGSANGDNAIITVRIDGSAMTNASDGIVITGANDTVDGLSITGFKGAIVNGTLINGEGIDVQGPDANIWGNFLGETPAGAPAGNQFLGVGITSGAPGATIGGTQPQFANVIGSNSFLNPSNSNGAFSVGIGIQDTGSVKVEGNYVGTTPSGTVAHGNGYGITLQSDGQAPSANNTIGGTTTSARNLISGNLSYGIKIQDASGNTIEGNFIGTNGAGTAKLPNYGGVAIESTGIDKSSANTIGPAAPSSGTAGANMISGNTFDAVDIIDAGTSTSASTIEGNFLGTNAAGTTAIGNGQAGVLVVNDRGSAAATGNTIGGSRSGTACTSPCNVIDGNPLDGIVLLDGQGTNVQGNYIGVAANGKNMLGNARDGVTVLGLGRFASSANTIGGTRTSTTCDGTCNLIGGNHIGVKVQEAGMNTSLGASSGNTVSGNFIGTTINGNGPAVAPNVVGVELVSDGTLPTADNIVGGSRSGDACTGHCNLISGNIIGVEILDAGIDPGGNAPTGNFVVGNFIGSDILGAHSMPNELGVGISSDGTAPAFGNTVGGSRTAADCANACNLISGNAQTGVGIVGAGVNPGLHATVPNTVTGNYIGLSIGGGALGNGVGVKVASQTVGAHLLPAAGNVIGGSRAGTTCSGPCNLIDANSTAGVMVLDAGTNPASGVTTPNQIQGNYVGADALGNPLGNSNGIVLTSDGAAATTGNLIGGSLSSASCAGTCNLISGNTKSGVLITYTGTTTSSQGVIGNTVSGNYIGPNATGTGATGSSSQPVGNAVGVTVAGSALGPTAGNTVGGSRSAATCTGPCNLISGNTQAGVLLFDTPAASTIGPNPVRGNFIGTDVSGAKRILRGSNAPGNLNGVVIESDGKVSATGNVIGGSLATPSCVGACNLISGNQSAGVLITLQGLSASAKGATGNTVSGNFIGTAIGGATAMGTDGNPLGNGVGVEIQGNGVAPSGDNTIGGSRSAASCTGPCNLISGNTQAGVQILDAGISPSVTGIGGNTVQGDFIGTDVTGTTALTPGKGTGIELTSDGNGATFGNIVGGNRTGPACTGPCDLISGNDTGVAIDTAGEDTLVGANVGNAVAGSYIGTDIHGATALPNLVGVALRGNVNQATSGNAIGCSDLFATPCTGRATTSACTGVCNLISGNNGADVTIFDAGANSNLHGKDGNTVSGNFIGPTVTGTSTLTTSTAPNPQAALVTVNSDGSAPTARNTIGGNVSSNGCMGPCNLITGVDSAGVLIEQTPTLSQAATTNNNVEGNFFGTDITGARALGLSVGVDLEDVVSNLVGLARAAGSACVSGCNLIDGADVFRNGLQAGVYQRGTVPGSTDGNFVGGNFIGTDVSGATAIGTDGKRLGNPFGIVLESGGQTGAGHNTVESNVVSGNGIGLVVAGETKNSVESNFVGPDVHGTTAVSNGTGVFIRMSTDSTIVQPAVDNSLGLSGEGNLISGNSGSGVLIHDCGANKANSVTANRIGVTATGGSLPNGSDGVDVSTDPSCNSFFATDGAEVSSNTIAFNKGAGVDVGSSSADDIKVAISQNAVFNNGGIGIELTGEAPTSCTSGPTSGAPNDYTPCPIINTATTAQITGIACNGCTVEVFIATGEADDSLHGEGKIFLGSVSADSTTGVWRLLLPSGTLTSGQFVTATATAFTSINGQGVTETSEFAANRTVTSASSGGITAGVTCSSANTTLPTCAPNPAGCAGNCTMALKVHTTCTSVVPPSCSGTAFADLAGNVLHVSSVDAGSVSPEAAGCTGSACSGSATYSGHGTYKGKTITYRIVAADDEQTDVDSLALTIIQSSGAAKTFAWTCRDCAELTVLSAPSQLH